MSVPPPYLEGFLAAVRPDRPRATPAAQGATPPTPNGAAAPPAPEEHLSWEERTKRGLHPLDSFVRLLDDAAANRPPAPDDRFRFQWFGLFYQAPEQDAYTLRLRLPGGRLKPAQLAGLADITRRHASGYVTPNSQGGLDVPGVPVTAAAEVLAQVEAVGLSAARTGGDCVQAVRGGELDDAPVDAGKRPLIYPLVCALERALVLGPVYSNLPLPCEIVLAGASEVFNPSLPAIEAVVLRMLTQAHSSPEAERSSSQGALFLLHLGGASEGFLIPPGRVVPACLNLLKSWATSADRSSRAGAGLATFLAGLDSGAICELLGASERVLLSTDSKPGVPSVEGEPSLGPLPFVARLLSGQLTALERCCREQGWREVSLRGGHLHAVGLNGEVLDATTILQQALTG